MLGTIKIENKRNWRKSKTNAYLEMFHQNCNDHVDKHKLCHKHKDDKEDWCDDCADTTVANAVIGTITIFTQGILKKIK